MFSLSSACQDHFPLVGACHAVKAVTLISLTWELWFCFWEMNPFFLACWWRPKILQIVFCVHFAFCIFYIVKMRFLLFFLKALTASECDVCHCMWYGNASCWRIALRMWICSSLLVYLVTICCIFQWPVKSNFGKTAVLCACAVLSFICDSAEALLGCSALNFVIQYFFLSFLYHQRHEH